MNEPLNAADIQGSLWEVARIKRSLDFLGGTEVYLTAFTTALKLAQLNDDRAAAGAFAAAMAAAILALRLSSAQYITTWQDGESVVVRFSPSQSGDSTPER